MPMNEFDNKVLFKVAPLVQYLMINLNLSRPCMGGQKEQLQKFL